MECWYCRLCGLRNIATAGSVTTRGTTLNLCFTHLQHKKSVLATHKRWAAKPPALTLQPKDDLSDPREKNL